MYRYTCIWIHAKGIFRRCVVYIKNFSPSRWTKFPTFNETIPRSPVNANATRTQPRLPREIASNNSRHPASGKAYGETYHTTACSWKRRNTTLTRRSTSDIFIYKSCLRRFFHRTTTTKTITPLPSVFRYLCFRLSSLVCSFLNRFYVPLTTSSFRSRSYLQTRLFFPARRGTVKPSLRDRDALFCSRMLVSSRS